MAAIDLTKYGITGSTEIVYNPSYETLFDEKRSHSAPRQRKNSAIRLLMCSS